MKVLLLLFCIAGFAYGFQPELRYKYHYQGVSETGIPEINDDGAAVGIDLDVYLEVSEDGHAVVQFKNIKVGEHHGCLGCDRKHPVDEYTEIRDHKIKEALEEPFEANLFGNADYSLAFEHDEILWLRNIRRAIVGLFRNQLLEANFDTCDCPQIKYIKESNEVPAIFSVQEETILGKCEVHYTVHKLAKILAADQNTEVVEGDVQIDHEESGEQNTSKGNTSKGKISLRKIKKYVSKMTKSTKQSKYTRTRSVPELEDELYHVTRTFNFDKCEHNVALRHSSGGLHSKTGSSTYSWTAARSSVAEYIFRGSGGAFRMERAVVEGTIAYRALITTEERLTAFTKQTLQLMSVEELSYPTKVSPSFYIHGWMQEVLSPFKEPTVSNKVPWIDYLDKSVIDRVTLTTANGQSKQENAARKNAVHTYLTNVALAAAAETPDDEVDPAITMDYLLKISRLLEALPEEDLEDLANEIMVENNVRPVDIYKQKFFVDTLIGSGTKKGSVDLVLKLLKSKKISSFQGMLMSTTVMNSLMDVTAIPAIGDYIMQISLKDEPFVASTHLINFANMVNHYCVDRSARTNHYAGAMFGDEGCDVDYLKSKFLPYITNIINDESKTWERIVAIKVLHKLGTTISLDILGPVVLGKKGTNDLLRTTAIYALSRWTLPWEARDHSMQILSEIYTNIGEIPRVRIAALIMYSSWSPEPSFFYRLARISWREPSMAVASFYHSLIKVFSEANHPLFTKQNQAASHAIKLMKPMTPALHYPFLTREYKTALDEHVSQIQEVGVLKFPYPEPKINLDVYSFNGDSINGMDMTVSEILMSSGGIGDFIQSYAKKYSLGKKSRIVEDVVKNLEDILKSEPKSARSPLITVYLRFYENMQFLLPFTEETIKSSQITDRVYLASILLELQTGFSRTLAKYMVLGSYTEFVPNEMGLPVFTTQGAYITYANTFNARLSLSSGSMTKLPKKAHLFIEEYPKLFSQIRGQLDVVVPWINSKISVSVKSTKSLSNPQLVTINIDADSMYTQPKFQVTFERAYDTKACLYNAKTVPATSIAPLTYTDNNSREPSIKILLKHKNIKKVVPIPQTYTGIAFTLIWDAQFRYPFDLYGLRKLYQDPSSVSSVLLSSHTAQYWSLQLQYDPTKSETNNLTIGITFQLADKGKKSEDISQIGQTSGGLDYHQYGQQSVDYDQNRYSQGTDDYVSFGQNEFMDSGDGQFEGGTQEFQEVDFSEVVDHGGVTINDNFQQKSAKMTDYYGSKANSIGINVGFYGENTREYEIFYSWSKPTYSNLRKKVKSQLTLLRSAIPGVDSNSLTVCIDSQKVTPVLSGVDTLESVLKKNLDVEIIRSITPNCEGKPVIVVESTMKLSPEKIEKLRKEIPKDCNYDSYDPLNTFYDTVYDQLHSKIKWEDVCDKNRLPILTKTINALDRAFLKGFHAFDCDMNDASNKLDIHLQKCIETDLWYFKVERDSNSFQIDALPSNRMIDLLFSIRMSSAQRHGQIMGIQKPSEKCVIKHGEVRTFDGKVYNYEPTECWTVAAKDCKNNGFYVLVRASTSESTVPEVRIIDRENYLIINNIRGEKPDDSGVTKYYSKITGKLVAKIYKEKGNYVVLLPNRVQVTMTDQVQIDILTKEVCGICGTNDHERVFEFVGPKQCIYTKPQQFVTAWTGEGETCDIYAEHEKRAEVESYQRTCPNIYDMFTRSPSYHEIHTEYLWYVKQIGNEHCITQHAHPQCKEGHISIKPNVINVKYNCYAKDHTPREVSKNIERGYTDHPVYYTPSSVKMSTVHTGVSCLSPYQE